MNNLYIVMDEDMTSDIGSIYWLIHENGTKLWNHFSSDYVFAKNDLIYTKEKELDKLYGKGNWMLKDYARIGIFKPKGALLTVDNNVDISTIKYSKEELQDSLQFFENSAFRHKDHLPFNCAIDLIKEALRLYPEY